MLVVSTTKLNYSHKKRPYLDYPSSIPQADINLQYNSKPLEVQTQTFKGFYNLSPDKNISFTSKKLFLTTTEKLSSSLSRFTLETLSQLGEKHSKIYKNVTEEFIDAVKTDAAFRKKLKLSNDWAEKISIDNLPQIPQQGVAVKFAQTVISPLTSLVELYKPLLKGELGKTIAPKLHSNIKKSREYETLISRYNGFLGLNHSIKIWENQYRQFSGNPHWMEGEEFLIPKDVLHENINSKRPQTMNPDKGQYSTKSLMLGNRLISGLVYAVYLSTDAYNTTMKFSGNDEESTKQRKSRFVQENARIGLNLYFQNLIFSTVEGAMNKSLATALLASGATVALSEIIGRQLVSKPIMPSDKETLDKMEEEMANRKGFFPALGRLMTRTKKAEPHHKETTSENPFAAKSINSFTSKPNKNNNVSFTGLERTARLFEPKQLKQMLDVITEFEPKQGEYYRNIIRKTLENVPLDEALNSTNPIQIGEKMTVQGKVMHSVFAPVYWVKSWTKSIKNATKNITPAVKNKESLDFIKQNKLDKEFQAFQKERLNLPAWQNSSFSASEKHNKILEEFVKINGSQQFAKQVQNIQNVLLWLEKQIKINNIDLSKLDEKQRTTLEKLIEKSIIASDNSKHLEYDGNTLTQLNVNLARIITTIFLVTDAYNLTMQYSNDNKKDAQSSAKNRAVQEITRISISAYMLGFIHNLLSKVCNSGLAGAFMVTALTSIVNDTLARIIVGVPLTPQSKEQLEKNKK